MDQPQSKGPAAPGLPPRYVPPVITPPPPTAPVATTPTPPEKENIKETVESILVAFILAFVFRAFVVEAFVIPSGSMAPTLLGAHMRYRCEECGYQFDVNYPSDRSDDENISIPNKTGPRPVNVRGHLQEKDISLSMHCPNCGFKVQQFKSDPYDSATNSPVHYGDRILVLKYLYEIQAPRRWDVVVFKTPWGSGRYETNFIKRLAGRPGEAVMILDGDVYVAPGDAEPDKRVWEVQTKRRTAQEALWRIVYDNDFYPRNAAVDRQSHPFILPWQQTEGSARMKLATFRAVGHERIGVVKGRCWIQDAGWRYHEP